MCSVYVFTVYQSSCRSNTSSLHRAPFVSLWDPLVLPLTIQQDLPGKKVPFLREKALHLGWVLSVVAKSEYAVLFSTQIGFTKWIQCFPLLHAVLFWLQILCQLYWQAGGRSVMFAGRKSNQSLEEFSCWHQFLDPSFFFLVRFPLQYPNDIYIYNYITFLYFHVIKWTYLRMHVELRLFPHVWVHLKILLKRLMGLFSSSPS